MTISMSNSVLNITLEEPLESFRLKLNNENLKYVHLDHSKSDSSGKNVIELAYENIDAKNKLVMLSNAGFMTYVLREGISSLVHINEVKKLWIPVKEGLYSCNKNNIVYEYKEAEITINKKLLVVFSQIPLKPFSSSLNRYFARNFSTIEKYIGKDVAILRIADLGGVTGAFYLNTNALPNNEKNIQSLISDIAYDNKITHDNVVLYGTSKGGTAALYHGLKCGYRIVAVDPILDDHYYISKLKDLHLIENIFPIDKLTLFKSLLNECGSNIRKLSLITSENSEQYQYILNILKPYLNDFLLLNNINKAINNHPEVGPNSLHAITALINMAFIGVSTNRGVYDFV